MPTPTYTALATRTLASTATSVTFSSIPATYRDLICVVSTPAPSSSPASVLLQINSDTGSNYSYVNMRGTGAATASATETITYVAVAQISTSQNNFIVQFLDYSTTDKHKSILSRSNSPAHLVLATAGRWANTAVITSFKLDMGGATFAVGSTFSLYGVIA
jgi:hypothetical protein